MTGANDDLPRGVDQLLEGMEKHWNTYDSAGFATHFQTEADFVDVLGRMWRGRQAIADLHQRNFDTIHAGSRLRMTRLSTQRLADGVALAHTDAAIWVPAGPLKGDSGATQTMVLCKGDGDDAWLIRAFHNTWIREIAGIPGRPAP